MVHLCCEKRCNRCDTILFHRIEVSVELWLVLRWFLTITGLTLSVGIALAQDESKRINPDDWLAQDLVRQMMVWADSHSEWSSGFVHSSAGRFLMPSGGKGQVFLRDGDLRVVADANGENKSVSHNLGFNLGANHFVYDGQIMSLGGRGFWNGHAKLVQFMERTGEWELVAMEKGPECVTHASSWFNSSHGEVIAIDERRWGRSTTDDPDVAWKLDLNAKEWSLLGKVNPRMQLFMRSQGLFFDLKDYGIWMGGHQTAVVRKSDLQVVLSPEWDYTDYVAMEVEVENAPMWMTGSSGNRFQVWSMDSVGKDTALVDWDVERAFETTADENEPMAWVVPLGKKEKALLTEVGSVNEKETSSGRARWVLALLLAGGLSYAAGRKSGVGRKRKGAGDEPNSENSYKSAEANGGNPELPTAAESILAKIKQLEKDGEGVMATEELNRFLELGVGVSSESKRAKRAQFIRDVNRVYQMRHGKNMIVREKDRNDRRRTIYVIHPHSSNA